MAEAAATLLGTCVLGFAGPVFAAQLCVERPGDMGRVNIASVEATVVSSSGSATKFKIVGEEKRCVELAPGVATVRLRFQDAYAWRDTDPNIAGQSYRVRIKPARTTTLVLCRSVSGRAGNQWALTPATGLKRVCVRYR